VLLSLGDAWVVRPTALIVGGKVADAVGETVADCVVRSAVVGNATVIVVF